MFDKVLQLPAPGDAQDRRWAAQIERVQQRVESVLLEGVCEVHTLLP